MDGALYFDKDICVPNEATCLAAKFFLLGMVPDSNFVSRLQALIEFGSKVQLYSPLLRLPLIPGRHQSSAISFRNDLLRRRAGAGRVSDKENTANDHLATSQNSPTGPDQIDKPAANTTLFDITGP